MVEIHSPYGLDSNRKQSNAPLAGLRVFFDGVFRGDYSLAIVNRNLARHLAKSGLNLTLYSPEPGWSKDAMLAEMPDIRRLFANAYPAPGEFDVHIRNTWPPVADNMIGRLHNAYVCFAWEESEAPRRIINHFNAHLDSITVLSNFVKRVFQESGLAIPVEVAGTGTDHILNFRPEPLPANLRKGVASRVLHVSSCFPRKGADRLIEAFSRKFSEADGVELLIKTFDNPHNTVEEDVAKALTSHPKSAPIRVVKQSLGYPQLIELMRTADVLAAPSRGEGFGLPLAEAMLLDTPVVTLGYGGQTDFCSDETAWLVDYKLAPSRSHLATATSQWAEPDTQSLTQQIERALLDKQASKEKVARGQVLLKDHFKWADVARRVVQSLEAALANDLSDAGAKGPAVTIDLVSTWSQACGIAMMSEHLFNTPALRPGLTRILARELRGDEIEGRPAELPVARPWGYEAKGVRRLKSAIARGRSDVLWMQHHPGFFSGPDLTELGAGLDGSKYRLKVITLHNVRETLGGRPQDWMASFDVVFVHTEDDLQFVEPKWLSKVSVVPLGMLSHLAPEKADGEHFTVGSFGFLYPHKNVPMLIEAFSMARRVEPNLRLKLLNCCRNDSRSWIERAKVEAMIERLGLAEVVEADFGFLPDEEVAERLGQCDLLCFPYGDSSESATAAARIALSLDRPLLCSKSGVLADVLPYSLVLTELNARRLAEALIVLSAEPNVLTLRDDARRQFAARHTYDAVADRHLKVIRSRLNA
jgi:glycosyltransferase involved in cell wall biosynthesis